ncbi:long-chain fatty acid--CoA ligase [Mycobacterium intracellulare]|uniref:AMP-dependent synthetase/ligase n=1 Tax=Mycobacterium intracellulare TaxID=1767 RepID=UPI0034D477E0
MTAPTTATDPGAATLCDLFDHTVRNHPDAIALSTADGTVSYTYAQYRAAAADVAAALHACGVRRGDVVALMFENRPDFHIVDAAIMHLGAVSCSIYNTSPARDIAYIIRTSGARIAVCEHQFVDRLREAAAQVTVVCIERDVEGTAALSDLPRTEGFDFDAAWRAVSPDDVLTLIYTSGTTGAPKPVELTHSSMAAEVLLAAEMLDFRVGDRVPSALPMAHAAQRWGTHYSGMAFGLHVVCIDDLGTLASNLVAIQPEIWGTVPRILEKMVAAVQARLGAETDPAKKRLADAAIEVGQRYAAALQQTRADGGEPPQALIDERQKVEPVLAAIRQAMGLANVRWLMVGAAPTAPHIQSYLAGLGLEVVEVWGMSELCAVATINPAGAQKFGTVGKPLREVQITLDDDGEILVRGPIVMRGYRGEPAATAEAFTVDGRLRTGDLGHIDAEGYLSITGRKKEIIVNAAGKNIAPVKVEAAVKAECPLIGSVVAIGDDRPYLTALIVLDPDALSQFAAAAAIPAERPEDLYDHDAVTAAVAQAVERANTQLARVEQIKRYKVLPRFWYAAGAELTPTLKVRRRVIAEKYRSDIDALYAAEGALL